VRRLLFAALLLLAAPGRAQDAPPVRLAIVGLSHDHVRLMLPSLGGRSDVILVGIVEPDTRLWAIYEKGYYLDPKLFFPTLGALRAATKVDAAAVFTSTFDHTRVVEECAPLGIDVMMEKPFAVDSAAGRRMAEAARKGGIQLVVNYETSWYPSVWSAYRFAVEGRGLGPIRKIVAHDGHQGPARISCSPQFFAWLTDPVLNGGGALMDFGCYGADLATWFMGDRRPLSVFAVAQHLQPNAYPKVEDDATIVVTYKDGQAILQPSWDYPYGRKDMEIYGDSGALRLPDRNSVFARLGEAPEAPLPAPAVEHPYDDPLLYLSAVVRGRIRPSGLASVETNLVVMEILDAARESVRTGRSVDLPAD
jgi:predicted dehydrogenase